jgi:hypothetical protein
MKIHKHTQTLVEIQIGEGENLFLETCQIEPDRVSLTYSPNNDLVFATFNKEDFQEFINGCQAYMDNASWGVPNRKTT